MRIRFQSQLVNIRPSSYLKALVLLCFVGLVTMGCSRYRNIRKQSYYHSAVKYFAKGDYNSAAIQSRNAVKVDPRFADAHYELAQCYLKLGYIKQAYDELNTTVDLTPGNLKAQEDLGYILFVGRKYDEAGAKAKWVISRDANNADAYALLANVDAAQGRHPQALAEMNKAVGISPSVPKYLNLAMLELAGKDSAAAEADFKRAEVFDPSSSLPVMALGNFYAAQHRYSEAEQEFGHAIELDPKSPAPRNELVRLLMAEDKQDQAEQAAREAAAALRDNPNGYAALANFYTMTGQQDKAITELARLTAQHPKDLKLKADYAQLLIFENKLDTANSAVGDILKRDSQNVPGLLDRAQILIKQGHGDGVITLLQPVLRSEPDNPGVHYFLGMGYNLTGKPDLAENEWREVIRLQPGNTNALEALAALQLRRGEFSQLEQSAAALIAHEPQSPLGYCYSGLVKASRSDLRGAEADLKKAIVIAPQSPLGYMRMGELLAAEKRLPESEKYFNVALSIDPSFPGTLRGLVRVCLAEKQPAKALVQVKEQISKQPDNSDIYVLLGELLSSQKDAPGAEAAFQKAVDLDPKNSEAVFNLGQLFTTQGAVDQAISTYRRAIQANPNDAASMVLWGNLEEKRGNWPKAQELYRKSLQVRPGYPPAANDLAYLMLNHGGNIDVALALVQDVRQVMPNSPDVADTLAWAYYKKGVYSTAIDLLKEALKKAPNNPEFNYHLGMAYQKNRERALAIEHLQRALSLDPGYSNADKIRKTLASLKG